MNLENRWHLLNNLGEALTKMMTREYTGLSRSLAPKIEENPVEITDELPVREKEVATNGIIRQRFDEMTKLQTEGLSIKGIARQLGMHRETVSKYMLVLHSGISERATFCKWSLRDYQSIENAISL